MKLITRTKLLVFLLSGTFLYSNGYAGSSEEASPSGSKLLRTVNAEVQIEGKYLTVGKTKLFYLEQGEGDPILFIHGNPTSSYLWRNVIPLVSPHGRAIAIDLAGMGNSGKPEIEYRYEEHYEYVEQFVHKLGLKNITLVVHDWGATLGFDLARRNPELVKRIAFMEGILPPIFPQPSYEAMGEEMGGMFRSLRDPVQGKEMIIKNNMFVENILPNFVNRPLGALEMEAYRAPYKKESDRKPLLAWPRELPIGGVPSENVKVFEGIKAFMSNSDIPFLLMYADPGVLVSEQLVEWYRAEIRNIDTAYVGAGLHFVQEDNPDLVGRAIVDWIKRS